ncbi:hypothetical protein CALCODRAFT_13960 [Calocera cornea HHB12733]|uniref:Uncharacterized protein n=1 Tax=Calocera cornea HHB12733 TaxID=1353952 RepID=A0A165EA59_9BASI|nr:hypothetical protein CALCODRAFT_13960 [Calocera cornea HHB12733]
MSCTLCRLITLIWEIDQSTGPCQIALVPASRPTGPGGRKRRQVSGHGSSSNPSYRRAAAPSPAPCREHIQPPQPSSSPRSRAPPRGRAKVIHRTYRLQGEAPSPVRSVGQGPGLGRLPPLGLRQPREVFPLTDWRSDMTAPVFPRRPGRGLHSDCRREEPAPAGRTALYVRHVVQAAA